MAHSTAASPRHSSWLADLRALTKATRPLHGWSFYLREDIRSRAELQDRLDILGADELQAVPRCTSTEKINLETKTRGWILAWPDEMGTFDETSGSEIVISVDYLADVERIGRPLPIKWYTCRHVCEKRRKSLATKQQSRRKRPTGNGTKPKKKRRRLAYTKSDDAILAEFVRSHRTKSPGGNALWKLAENENLLPGRTWQSPKDHFLKYVQKQKIHQQCYRG